MRGCTILDGILSMHGFERGGLTSGMGSGGCFATTDYTNGSRKLELHYRYSLGLVTYHFDSLSLGHEAYMYAVLGPAGGNKYPGFWDDPLEAFRGLAHDIEKFAVAFLAGDKVEFGRCSESARKQASLSGFERLVKGEG